MNKEIDALQLNDLGRVPLERVPFLGHFSRDFWNNFDSLIGYGGLEYAALEFITSRNGVVDVHYDTEYTREVLSNNGVLVVAEHPDFFHDVFSIIGALPTRPKEETSIVALLDNCGIGRNFSEHLIEIKINDRVEANSFSRKLWRKYCYEPPVFSVRDAIRTNFESINTVVSMVKSGKRVIFFPDGVRLGNGWQKAGLRRIVQDLKNTQSLIVFALANGSNKNLLCLTPLIRNMKPFHAEVHFSEPLSISQISQQTANRRELTAQCLENSYALWALSKTKFKTI